MKFKVNFYLPFHKVRIPGNWRDRKDESKDKGSRSPGPSQQDRAHRTHWKDKIGDEELCDISGLVLPLTC